MINEHTTHMHRCIELAKKAIGHTSPNPYVGAVIVKNGKVIAEGHHKKAGTDHAEADALKNATEDVQGATLYCNLEPCCHTNKRTPPCVKKIIEAKIAKVIIANLDPNPSVSGKGVKQLEQAGIEVVTGILKDEGELLNEVFFTNMREKRPFIHLKWAQTIDGKIATLNYSSKWITNSDARTCSHKERFLYDAIMVGDTTIQKDNPSLSIRLGDKERCTKRVILNPTVELDRDSKIFTDQFSGNTILVRKAPSTFWENQILLDSPKGGSFNLNDLLEKLYAKDITSIYIEGGMSTISSFIDQELFDRISIFTAPKLLGPGVGLSTKIKEQMSEALEFPDGVYTQIGNNILFESKRNICLQD